MKTKATHYAQGARNNFILQGKMKELSPCSETFYGNETKCSLDVVVCDIKTLLSSCVVISAIAKILRKNYYLIMIMIYQQSTNKMLSGKNKDFFSEKHASEVEEVHPRRAFLSSVSLNPWKTFLASYILHRYSPVRTAIFYAGAIGDPNRLRLGTRVGDDARERSATGASQISNPLAWDPSRLGIGAGALSQRPDQDLVLRVLGGGTDAAEAGAGGSIILPVRLLAEFMVGGKY